MHSAKTISRIHNLMVTTQDKWNPDEDCGFCGHQINKTTRKSAKISPNSIISRYPCTACYIFPKCSKDHKSTCTACYSLIKYAIRDVSEDEFVKKLTSGIRTQSLNDETTSTNQNPSNGNLRPFNESSQSDKIVLDSSNLKRKLENLSTNGSPSKKLMQAENTYHILIDGDIVQVYKEPRPFQKLDKGPGRPGISPDLVDYSADMQVQAGVSANRVAMAKEIHDKIWIGRAHPRCGSSEKIWSTQTNVRCLSIKNHASDLVVCKWMANQVSIFAGFDGCSASKRHFMQFHLTGCDRDGNVSKQSLLVRELSTSTTGPEMAELFCKHIEELLKCALKNGIRITTLLSLDGLTFDTTSENTGKYNGIAEQINLRRKTLWETVQAKLPESARRPYQLLLKIPCCDHVSCLILVHFMKMVVEHLRESNLTNLIQGDNCIVVPMFESFGNLLAEEDGDIILGSIFKDVEKDIFKTSLNISFQRVDPTRYLALPVLIEKFLEFESYIQKHMETLLATGKLSDVQKRFWLLWKTNPMVRGIALLLVKGKNQYLQPMMRVGNTTHSWTEWKSCLETTLKDATKMRNEESQELSDDVFKSFENIPLQNSKDVIQTHLRRLNVLLGDAIIFILQKWYGDIITSVDNGNKWIVATNRESERFVSILKLCLELSLNISELLINAYMRLRFCIFSFVKDIPEELHYSYIKKGRDDYNNHKTRKEVNSEKKQAYDKGMAISLEKFAERSREQNIFRFMHDCGAELEPKIPKKSGKEPKMSVTVDQLKEFLGKLKRHGLYDGEVNQRLKIDYLGILETQLMPQGATVFRTAYTKQ